MNKYFLFSAMAFAILIFGCKKNTNDTNVAVTGVSLNKTTLSLVTGTTETLTATIAPANATNKNVSWSSSSDAIATVDNTGKVTAVAAGTATITVTTADGNKTATCAVTVTMPVGATQVVGWYTGQNTMFAHSAQPTAPATLWGVTTADNAWHFNTTYKLPGNAASYELTWNSKGMNYWKDEIYLETSWAASTSLSDATYLTIKVYTTSSIPKEIAPKIAIVDGSGAWKTIVYLSDVLTGDIPSNTWITINIPLSSLGAVTTAQAVVFQNAAETAGNMDTVPRTLYIGYIGFTK